MNVLIVDDEPVARRGLARQLSRLGGVKCVGECQGPQDAVAAIVEQRPDVVLLDVQLGDATAFEIIEEIGADAMPLVVFVTAYDRHALKAFEVHAVDYVLKPVDPVRLREALDRADHLLSWQRRSSRADRLDALLAAYAGESSGPAMGLDRLVVRDGDRLCFVEVDQIDWLESAGNYVRVHIAGLRYAVRATLDQMERRLRTRGHFVRIRRAVLVNVRAVTALERYAKGMYVVQLRSGTRLISSRYHYHALRGLVQVEG